MIDMDGFLTEQSLQEAREILDNPQLVDKITEHNYELARRYYSLHVLRDHVATLLHHHFPDL